MIGTTDMSSVLTGCMTTCFSDSDPSGCTADCVATDAGLSAGCSTCYGELGVCIVDNCLTDCLSDPSSVACTDCTDSACGTEFTACSGIPIDEAGLW